MTGSSIWAVTCLFNPRRAATRLANFRTFRRRLNAPLLAVELSFDGRFELQPHDADILVQLDAGDVMWQKERLLNIGIARLPDDCHYVATIDADVVFANNRWPTEAVAALQQTPMVQLFTEAYYLAPDAEPDAAGKATVHGRQSSAARAIARGASPEECLGVQSGTDRGRFSGGFAWAFRRDLIAAHGLYDCCIIGGGDTAVVTGATGAFATVERRHSMSAAQCRRYRAWAVPWFKHTAGKIDALDGDLFHLWHGALENRQANSRHQALAAAGFDPEVDISAPPAAAWRWASDKPGLHQLLTNYFAARREDEPACVPS